MTKYRSRWCAALFSILTPSGLAQVYNGQPRKALLFFIAYWSTVGAVMFTGVATSVIGLAAMGLAGFVLLVVSYIDALKNSGRDLQLKWYNRWYFYLLYYAVVLVVVGHVKFAVEAFKMSAGSMQPTILPGEKFIVDKRVSARQSLHRGDIILFIYPVDSRKTYIKRLIGLPGDHIRTEGTDLYLNGQKLVHLLIKQEKDLSVFDEGFESDGYCVQYMPSHTYADQEYVVPDGQLFVMGDNRDNSADSREWGFVPMSDVQGKAQFTYWSPDHRRIGHSL